MKNLFKIGRTVPVTPWSDAAKYVRVIVTTICLNVATLLLAFGAGRASYSESLHLVQAVTKLGTIVRSAPLLKAEGDELSCRRL